MQRDWKSGSVSFNLSWKNCYPHKCTNRQNKHNNHCDSQNLPMDRMDEIVLRQFADKVLVPERLAGMFAEWRKQLKQQKAEQQAKGEQTQKALNDLEKKQNNLLAAIEHGLIAPNDETIVTRMHKLKAERETLLLELASTRRAVGQDHTQANRALLCSIAGKAVHRQHVCQAVPANLGDRNSGEQRRC